MLDRLKNSLSSTYHDFKVYEPIHACSTIFDYLNHFFPHIDKNSWLERLSYGGIYVNGFEISGDVSPNFPFWIEYLEPKFNIKDAQNHFPKFDPSWILYEDEFLIAVWKPYGLSTLRTREQRHYNLKSYLTRYTKQKIHLPSRLDTSACGIVLVSKNEKFDASLQHIFSRRLIEKVYIAEGSGESFFQEKTVNLKIKKNSLHRILRSVSPLEGKESLTHFKKILSREIKTSKDIIVPTTLFQVRPKTGRTHQIRVHAQAIHLPLVGDNFYGGYDNENLHLMAYQMNFIHPITKEKVLLSVPEEKIPLWAKAAI